ncbi:MAG: MbtH family protein [Candidatus Methylumidiphilus sp.]
MHEEDSDNATIYKVVVNLEEQYSIWPADRENPVGWKDVGTQGAKAECLAHIESVWTDMRPLSLRRQMEEASRAPRPDSAAPAEETAGHDLVKYLTEGTHPVEASLRPDKTAAALRQSIDNGYVHIKFTDTQGGTEIGVRLDAAASDLSQADFNNGTGTAHLVGGLILDDVKVRCNVDIGLETLAGQGRLAVAG